MNQPKKEKFKKILNRIISMYLKKESTYKGQIFVWIVADILKVIGLAFVWIAASKLTENISQSYVVSYYLLLVFVSKSTQDYIPEYGIRNIIDGTFSNNLIKPFNHLIEYLGINIATNILRIFIFLPAFIVGIVMALKYDFLVVDVTPYKIFLMLIAIIIGFSINFLLGNILTLFSFKIKQMDGIRITYYNFSALLSGEYIPMIFLPLTGQFILQMLPFRYTLSFPVELIMGKLGSYDINMGFLISLIWLVLLYFIYKIGYKFAVKKYEAEGI